MSASLFAAPIALSDVADAAFHGFPRETEPGPTTSAVLDQPAEQVVQAPDESDLGLGPGPAAKLRRRPPPSLTAEQQQIIAGLLSAACRCRACVHAGWAADAADVQACEHFIHAVLEWLREFANRHLRPDDRDDFVQEVGRRAVEKLHEFDCDPALASFTPWLWDVAEHHRIDLWRRFARRRTRALRPDDELVPDSGDDDPLARLGRAEDREMTRLALVELREQVSDTSYQILVMQDLCGRSVLQTADALGLTPKQVTERHHLMRKRLARIAHRDASSCPSSTSRRHSQKGSENSTL